MTKTMILEKISYHPEKNLIGNRQESALPVHADQQDHFIDRPALPITEKEYKK